MDTEQKAKKAAAETQKTADAKTANDKMLAARKQAEKDKAKDAATTAKNSKNAKKSTGSPGKEGAK